MASAEAKVAELESQLKTIDLDLADPELFSADIDKANALVAERSQVAARLAQAEEELLEFYE